MSSLQFRPALRIDSGPTAGYTTAMLTAATFDQLKNAAHKYLNDPAFGVPEVAELMAEIFGNNPDGTDNLAWSAYWTQLNIYEESVRDGKEDCEAPEV